MRQQRASHRKKIRGLFRILARLGSCSLQIAARACCYQSVEGLESSLEPSALQNFENIATTMLSSHLKGVASI